MKAICCCRAKGYHTGGILLAALGLVKGTAGLPLRPTIGILEGASKATYSLGLLCLGRDAITGSTLRRVRAPGALMDDSTEVKAAFAKNTAVVFWQRPCILAINMCCWHQSKGTTEKLPSFRDQTLGCISRLAACHHADQSIH